MAVMWVATTICVIALAVLYGRRRTHSFVPRGEDAAPTVGEWALADDRGFAELMLPATWKRYRSDRSGNPQARQANGARFVQIISECKGDFVEEVTLDGHSAITRQLLGENIRLLSMHGPTYRFVGRYAAVQYECDAVLNSVHLRFLHTTVDGDRAFHQIVCRSPRSQFDRAAFDRLLDNFRESPGPPPPPDVEDQMPVLVSDTGSDYKVH